MSTSENIVLTDEQVVEMRKISEQTDKFFKQVEEDQESTRNMQRLGL